MSYLGSTQHGINLDTSLEAQEPYSNRQITGQTLDSAKFINGPNMMDLEVKAAKTDEEETYSVLQRGHNQKRNPKYQVVTCVIRYFPTSQIFIP